jgi:hypothetical protein
MRLVFALVALLVPAATVARQATAAPFQNLSFENFTTSPATGPTLDHWSLFGQFGNGQPAGPGAPWPGIGMHIGDIPMMLLTGPTAPVGGDSYPSLEGNFSLLSIGHADAFAPYFTAASAQAVYDQSKIAGLAQTGVVPAGAKSIWIVSTPRTPESIDLRFSTHRVTLEEATSGEFASMLLNEGLTAPTPQDPTSPPVSPWPSLPTAYEVFAGNISTIAGLERELKILPPNRLTSYPAGAQSPYDGQFINQPFWIVSAGGMMIDMIVFSSLPWDGPAVNVPEPAAALLLLPAIATLRRRRRAPPSP